VNCQGQCEIRRWFLKWEKTLDLGPITNLGLLLYFIANIYLKNWTRSLYLGANLLLDNNGILKIAYFGLATFFNPKQKQHLTSRVIFEHQYEFIMLHYFSFNGPFHQSAAPALHESDNSAMWLHGGAGSRTISAVPPGNFYGFQGQS
ncbi:hypothetical protein ACJX0J_013072, partial [Zea mays]